MIKKLIILFYCHIITYTSATIETTLFQHSIPEQSTLIHDGTSNPTIKYQTSEKTTLGTTIDATIYATKSTTLNVTSSSFAPTTVTFPQFETTKNIFTSTTKPYESCHDQVNSSNNNNCIQSLCTIPQYKKIMKIICPKTCGYCGVTNTSLPQRCLDKNINCKGSAKELCKSYKAMSIMCPCLCSSQ
ncbi:ShKT domain-containing protein [Strongyloides ratti]|uniref:ShKT domain-containing protein n=1 Tax=Strongyloides ratti TaxID=34506 RepID=A0A090N0B0_STRRB|nr:ShKT domain-containing protein [Strongyloides ratti]CEF70372.1 ShKT domain-containing protein [Strongyloides ratti]